MAFTREHLDNYHRRIQETATAAQAIPAIPTCLGYSTVGIDRSPAGISNIADSAYNEALRKIDNQRQDLINGVMHKVHASDNQARRLDPAWVPSYTRSFPITLNITNVPEIPFLGELSTYCRRRETYLRSIGYCAADWESWLAEIHLYFTTGVVSENGDQLTELERSVITKDGDKVARQIRRDYLAAYFTEVKNTKLYSSRSETSAAVEGTKKKLATAGHQLVVDIINACNSKTIINAGNEAKTRADAYKIEGDHVTNLNSRLLTQISTIKNSTRRIQFTGGTYTVR